jgi:hypothetical protein
MTISLLDYCDIHEIKSSSLMAEITTPDLLQSYITEKTIPNDIPTQTLRSQATQLRLQLTTTNWLPKQALQLIFPTKPYEISRQRSNDRQGRG